MKWAMGAVVVAIAAAIAVNVLLLGYGGARNDPVGQLSPVASLPRPSVAPQPAPATTTTTKSGDHHDGQSSDD
jgi:hypothetical protein